MKSYKSYLDSYINEEISVPDKHQLKIAINTIKMSQAGAKVAGGMDHKGAIKVLKKNGYSDDKIIKMLKSAGHDDDDIKKFMNLSENFEDEHGLDFGETEQEDKIEPEDDDFYIADNTRGGYDISVEGKNIGHEIELEDALNLIKQWMKKHNFYPSIWFVNDHGNMILIDDNGNEIKR